MGVSSQTHIVVIPKDKVICSENINYTKTQNDLEIRNKIKKLKT